MFKSMMVYRFNKEFKIKAEEIKLAVEDFKFFPCSPQDIGRFGFCEIEQAGSMVYDFDGGIMIKAKLQEKMIPGHVINSQLKEKVALIEKAENRKVYKKERDALKDELVTDLLPKAFVKDSYITAIIVDAYFGKAILINSSSSAKAESFLALLRKALGSLPVIPLSTKADFSFCVTSELKESGTFSPFEFEGDFNLNSNLTEGGKAKFKNYDSADEELTLCIDSGKMVDSCTLSFGQSMTFEIKSCLSINKIKFSEEFAASNDDMGNEDLVARFDADTILQTKELISLLNSIVKKLDGVEIGI